MYISFQSERNGKTHINIQLNTHREMTYLLFKNIELIDENRRTKINYELLYEEYKRLENNCSLFHSKSAIIQ